MHGALQEARCYVIRVYRFNSGLCFAIIAVVKAVVDQSERSVSMRDRLCSIQIISIVLLGLEF